MSSSDQLPLTAAVLPLLARQLSGTLDAHALVALVDGRPVRAHLRNDRLSLTIAVAREAPAHSDRAALRALAARGNVGSALLVLHPPSSGDWRHDVRIYAAARVEGRLLPVEVVDARLSIGLDDRLSLIDSHGTALQLDVNGVWASGDVASDDLAWGRTAATAWWQHVLRLTEEAA